jgi:uncharacterized membrane protein
MIELENSLEWGECETKLLRMSTGLSYFSDIKRLIHNVQLEVTQLSIAEVETRRCKHDVSSNVLAKVNDSIKMVEEFILVAKIIG